MVSSQHARKLEVDILSLRITVPKYFKMDIQCISLYIYFMYVQKKPVPDFKYCDKVRKFDEQSNYARIMASSVTKEQFGGTLSE